MSTRERLRRLLAGLRASPPPPAAGRAAGTYPVRRGLSVQDPWATALVHGLQLDGRLYRKTAELRTWAPPSSAIDERIAICATLGVNARALAHFGVSTEGMRPGYAIGFVTLVGYHDATIADGPASFVEITERMLEEQRATGRPWLAWEVQEPRACSPFAVSGAPGRLLDLAALDLLEDFRFEQVDGSAMSRDRLFPLVSRS